MRSTTETRIGDVSAPGEGGADAAIEADEKEQTAAQPEAGEGEGAVDAKENGAGEKEDGGGESGAGGDSVEVAS